MLDEGIFMFIRSHESHDFAHSYAAKVASLGAMFVMALALFGLLPELHAHVMRIIETPLRRRSSGS